MQKIYGILLIALSLALSYATVSAWQWPWHKEKEKHEGPKTTWRWAGLLKDSMHAHEKCAATCARHHEKWTSHWKTSWFGNECQCRSEDKPTHGWSKQQPAEEQSKNITYRAAGTIHSPDDLASECPKICSEHKEKHTGRWKHGWFGGYKCECKRPSRP